MPRATRASCTSRRARDMAVRSVQEIRGMSHRTNGRAGGNNSRLVTGKRRDALGLLLDAVDAVIEDGIPHPGWDRSDAEIRTCALEADQIGRAHV